MKLKSIHEAISGPALLGRIIKGPQIDDSNQLVAYRLYLLDNRVSSLWAVSFQGTCLGYIMKQDSTWVHDNYQNSISDEGTKLLTMANSKYIHDQMDMLAIQVMGAVHERKADAVALPMDMAKVNIGKPVVEGAAATLSAMASRASHNAMSLEDHEQAIILHRTALERFLKRTNKQDPNFTLPPDEESARLAAYHANMLHHHRQMVAEIENERFDTPPLE